MKKILIIDDEPDFTLSIKLNLEARGDFTVFECPDGEKAMPRIMEVEPDVILLDVLMPGLTGPEVVEQLRAKPETAEIPVIFVTASVTEEKLCAQWGEMVLTKPVKIHQVIEAITAVLSKPKGTQPPGETQDG